jgi:hypothetical protein
MGMPKSASPAFIHPAPMAKTALQAPGGMTSPRSITRDIQGLHWSEIPGSASQVAASADGSIWVLSTQPSGPDKYIWHYASGSWTNISGEASQLAVAPNGTLYAINSGGGTYAYDGGTWTALGGGASGITTVADGSFYVLSNGNTAGSDQAIWHNVGGAWSQVPGSGLTITGSFDTGSYTLPGGTVSPGGFYILNSQGSIYYENTGGGFAQLPANSSALAPTTVGGVFALGYPANAGGNALYFYDLTAPGWSAQSGAGVSLSSNAGKLYVIGASGAIYASPASLTGATTTFTANAAGPDIAISYDVLGASMATWSDNTIPGIAQAFDNAGLRLVRWPGGSESDSYHWENGGSVCAAGGGYVYPPSTFDNFMNDVAIAGNLHVALTVDYGSNQACNAGGDPAEAAAWVAYAKLHGYHISYWTVGNEEYGSWEFDLHSLHNDPTTYANAVATGFYPQMKAADSSAKVGVVLAGNYDPGWDSIVLANAKYDFVEFHYYAQAPGSETDAYLLNQAPTDFGAQLASLKSEMQAAGVNVPIYVGELNSVYSSPGKQSVSIVNGLFAGEAIAQMMQHGVGLSTWWIAFGGCNEGNNVSPSLYGWQSFGTYTMFSDGLPGEGCTNTGTIPFGTFFPPADAYELASVFAPNGASLLPVSGSATNVKAYADATPSGYAFWLFNLDENNAATVSLGLSGASKNAFSATSVVYGKLQYDQSQSGVWAGPVTNSPSSVTMPYTVSLPPWSMTVVTLH